nr:glycosyltransferase 87 family protein [Actinomycetota bacterium]
MTLEPVARSRPPGRTAQRGWIAGFWGSAVAGVVLSVAEATSRPILGARWTLLDVLAAWAGVWVVGVVCALHLPMRRRRALIAIAVVATALRVAALASGPTLSDDLYRYSWDARVQISGVDPYRYPPQAKALRPLREGWLWPDAAGCAHIMRPPGCTRINRPSDRTIYPPVAEGWFGAVYRLGGGIGSRYKLWQGAGLATELGTMGLLTALLIRRRRDPRWLALYALCPVPVVEVVNDGHIDGLAILFLIAAFLALAPRWAPPGGTAPRASPSTWRAAAAGALIGASALVKLYPIVVLLAVWVAPGIRWRHRLASGSAAVGVVVLGYAPHVAAVGIKVLGYLPGYLKEEHYTGTSSRFLLAALFHLHGHAAEVAVVAAVVVTGLVLIIRRPPAIQAATVLIGVLLLA